MKTKQKRKKNEMRKKLTNIVNKNKNLRKKNTCKVRFI